MGGIHRRNDNATRVHVLQGFGGGLAGGVMRTATHPLDLLKIRMQLQTGHHSKRKYRGILHGVRTLYADGGMRSLVRGHNISQAMGILQGLVQFWSYEQLSIVSRKVSYLKEHRFLRHFLCGGFAGCLSTTAAHPLDLIRAQVMSADVVTVRSTAQGFRHIYTMKGWKGFTHGLPFALLETFPLMGFKFFCFKYLNAITLSVNQTKKMDINGGLSILVNAAVAGGIAKIAVYPVDLLRKRIQLRTFKHEHDKSQHFHDCPTFLRCIATTMHYEGVRGFYKGLWPTLVRSMLANAIYFSIYDLFSRQFIAPLLESED